MSPPLLQVEGLHKRFGAGPATLRAVDGVSFTLARGEALGIVGESGSGKSTLARCILRLIEPSAGAVRFDGIDVLAQPPAALRRLRRRMQILFQDATGALDPRMSVRRLVEEPLAIHGLHRGPARRATAEAMLSLVGIAPHTADAPPSSFSGGQRQRIGLARALVLEPELLVLDEPVSALDVSVQAQILNLLRDVQDRFALTILFIVHDLTVAEFFCDRVAVLYRGRIMELAASATLFRRALHPYTVSLLSAMPRHGQPRIVLTGEVSPLGSPSLGCPFQPRCPVGRTRPVCAAETPPLAAVGADHVAACHFPGALTPGS